MRHEFNCIDGHTCGNPVRLVTSGHPSLKGETMMERRLDFLKNYDWIRTGLMFEPRGHDMMSGSFLYPSNHPDADIGVLYIETSGCLPMCGHGTIGTITFAIEYGYVKPKQPLDENGVGKITIETPAGLVGIEYCQIGDKVKWVKLFNVASFLAHENLSVECPDLGEIKFDIAYGGNFYAIVEAQENYQGIDEFGAKNILRYSPIMRDLINEKYDIFHPTDENIKGLSHMLWCGDVKDPKASARNAVFYGENAIDRSPCGTGTSARMAQRHAKGLLKQGEDFIHESIIGSQFIGRVESTTNVGEIDAIMPSIQGWALVTGENKIYIDDEDPYCHGFWV